MLLFVCFFAVLGLLYFAPGHALAAWTPMIQAADFDGIRTDTLTAATGIIGLVVLIVGVVMIVRVLAR